MDRKVLAATGVALAFLVVFATFAGGMFLGQTLEKQKTEAYRQGLPSVQKVQEVFSIIDHAYVEEISDKKLINGAVEGMLEALDDPYTHYFDKTHFDKFMEDTTGHFDGVGIVISENKDKELVVISPIDGTPADKAGIKENDVITKIDDKATKGKNSDEAVKLIRGKRGTKVKLTIRREGSKAPLVFNLVRAQINIPNVSSEKVDGDIGYLRLHQFNEQTQADLKKHYEELKAQKVKGVVFDLRNNPGGILEQSVDVGSMWIKSGAIVKVKSRTGQIESRNANGGADEEMPLVILVNKGSASAAEIVAGAMQDYKRAVIVGETTFGKASVQTVINLSDGSGILLTTDKYLTPKGRMIHKKGIKPDIVIKFDPHKDKEDVQLKKAEEVLRELISGKRVLKAAS